MLNLLIIIFIGTPLQKAEKYMIDLLRKLSIFVFNEYLGSIKFSVYILQCRYTIRVENFKTRFRKIDLTRSELGGEIFHKCEKLIQKSYFGHFE